MAPIILDPNSDTTVYLIEMDDQERVSRIEFRVLAAALGRNSYWNNLLDKSNNANSSVDFRPGGDLDEHAEDTVISATSFEIVLRALHLDYHTDFHASEDEAAGGESGPATSTLKEEERDEYKADECKSPAKLDATTTKSPIFGGATNRKPPAQLERYFPKELFEVPISDVWGVLLLSNFKTCGVEYKAKLDVDRKLLQPWFCKWRETSLPTFSKQHDFEFILFPTFAFNDAKGWFHVTEWLCKHTGRGQIEEYSPFRNNAAMDSYRRLHLPKEVIARIRVCRSQLYVRMEEALWHLIRGIWFSDEATCACRVVAAYNYRKALQTAQALERRPVKGRRVEDDTVLHYPDRLDQAKTIEQLIDRLDRVAYEEPLNPCITCAGVAVKSHLSEAKAVATEFKGLCLDCMEASLDVDTFPGLEPRERYHSYRNQLAFDPDRGHDWCSHCRVPHGHTTWYFSWVNPIARQTIFPPPPPTRKKGGQRRDLFVLDRLRRSDW